ncbi:unnamed protein product [Mycena citricolor]|uniref:Uncharacterized protein n=1 Tax=Mycena citricolor TaxID=2018698 RepID=A0AAD2GVL5_9AGAR|nr:unnamed protein product [Mycena citricolor]CAK5276005.1 unnamed protein product [Mycena citricolor]
MVIDDMDPEELEYGNDLVDNGVEAEDSESDRGPWRSTLSSDASLASWCNMECLHVERCISLFSHGEHGRRAATTDLAGNIDFGGGAGHYGTGRAAGWPLGGDGGTRRRLFAIRSASRRDGKVGKQSVFRQAKVKTGRKTYWIEKCDTTRSRCHGHSIFNVHASP